MPFVPNAQVAEILTKGLFNPSMNFSASWTCLTSMHQRRGGGQTLYIYLSRLIRTSLSGIKYESYWILLGGSFDYIDLLPYSFLS
jgi:hypothetical protein